MPFVTQKNICNKYSKFFLGFLLIFVLNSSKAQVILSESFEGGSFPPLGWTLINASTVGSANWVRDINHPVSGIYSMACYNGNDAPNAWAFTPSLSLTGGNVYRISYWYKMNSPTAASGFKVTVGNNPNVASQNAVLHNYSSVTNSVYTEGVDYFDAPVTGNYNFAFNCTSAGGYYAYALELDSIVIKEMPKCSGIPVIAITTTTPTICGADTAVVKITGNYNFFGLSFQWQSSASGANNFSNIPNATDTFIKVSPTSSSDYRCIISCSVSGLNNVSNIVAININPSCYCHLPPTDCQFGYIANVTFAGINNSSGCSPQGFNYYSAIAPSSIYPASSMPINVTVSPGAYKFVGVWIDFDKNGRFDSTEFTSLGFSNGTITGSITIPSNAVLGTTRMRVRQRVAYGFSKTDACVASSDMTETEEYNVNILTLTPCSVVPVGGTATSSVSSICPLTNFTLSVTGSSINGVVPSYQWQSSLNNSTWADIPGATAATLITQQSVATYYRRKIICNNSLFSYSTVFLQTLSPYANCYCTPTASSCGGTAITSVQLGSINNASGCLSYVNYSSTVPPASINAGTFVPITVSFTANAVFTGTGYVKAWLDFNQNGIFENAESFNIASSGSNATSTFLIRIPFDARAGLTRMRIKIETGGFDQIIPCIPRTSGETEDYAVNITASPTPAKFFVVYANKIASGANNGSTWANALTSLSTAFAIVKGSDTIKVAKGSYTPGYLLTDGVNYLGGYPNTGNPADADRNFSLHTTVLSGQEMFGYQLSNTTTFNGFVIDSLSSQSGFNAAIRLENSNPVITNCIFKNNKDRVLYLNYSSPEISNCFFLNNSDSYLNKGQIQLLNNSAPKITNCVFNKNESTSMINVTGSTLKLTNCTFINNKIKYFNIGSIVTQAEIITTANSSANITNCIFSDYWNGNSYYTYSKLTDSSNVFTDNTSTASVNNCITTYNQAGTNLLRMVDAKFKDTSNAAGADNLFFTSDDGLQIINPCSPAMNTGLNTAVQINTDILGNQRIVSTAVDMGAYEIQTNPVAVPGTLFVNALATGNNDGTSWVNAFTNLQTAFAYCSDTIKVAAGTYYPAITDKQSFFQLQNNRVILGGYPNTGNPSNNLRNPITNPTILNGNLPGTGNVKSDNIVQGILVDSTAILNGFTIQGGQSGAVYISFKATPVISNCKISNNITAAFVYKQSNPQFFKCNFINNSGGINIDNSAPIIDSCSFIKTIGYSAISNSNRSLSVIKNSSFFGNYNLASGGDIFNDNSDPQISNCFSDSAYAYFGGSIANVNNSSPVITKCVFTNGQTPYFVSVTGGAVCYNNNSKPYFSNCSFINSKGAGGAFYNTNGTVIKLENCLAYGNSPAGSQPSGTSFMQNWSSTADVINSTIIKNVRGSEVFGNGNSSVLNIKNSILWNNNFNYGEDIYYQIVMNTYNKEVTNATSSVTNITNSITRIYGVNGTNGNMVGVDPRFININKPAGADGIYGTNDDGLQLCSCSPAVNTAINTANTASIDIAGNPRVANTIIDRGAFEYQPSLITTSKTRFVSASASGLQNGDTWVNAYNNLQEAINNPCADTIKIMEGIYKPAINNRDSSFEISRKLYLMGGYQNSVSPSEADRNPDDYPTILSGEIGNATDTTDNSYIILKINYTDTLVKLDGVTFKNCFHNNKQGTNVLDGGAVFSLNNKNVVLKNCRFYKNHSSFPFSPNSLKSYNSFINLSNIVFSKNYSIDGYTVEISSGGFNNCVFAENYSLRGTGVISNGKTDFKNCLFYKNFAGGGGAGVFNKGIATFINCNFIENRANVNGAGLLNTNNSRAYLLNCILSGNYTGNGIYADWYDYRGAPIGESQYNLDFRYFKIENSVYQTFFPYQNTIVPTGNEKFANISNAIGPDNKWFTSDDGLKLLSCSPIIDKGITFTGQVLESVIVAMPVTDILDSQRVVGAKIDIGAYEYPGYYNPVVRITASDSVICTGTLVTFSAATTGAGTNPVYQWKVNNVNVGTNSNLFSSSILTNNDKVSVILTSTDTCITNTIINSNIITIHVNSVLTPVVSISTSNSNVCQGASSTFSAIPTNGGSSPSYQWQVNGINKGINSNTFTSSTLTNNDNIKVILTSSLSCASPAAATSNIITMSVSAVPTANAGQDAAICTGSSIQLSAAGGTTYSWSPATGLNNANIANPIATPAVTTAYILTVTNGNTCFSKDTVVITVNHPTPSTVNINTASTTVCAANNIIFSAVPINGGTSPAYQWQVNGINAGTNSNQFSSTSLNNNDAVKVILTSNSTCTTTPVAISNIIVMAVQQLVTPVVTLNNRVYTVTNPDAAAIYTWQVLNNNNWVNVNPAAMGISYTAVSSGEYRVMVAKGVCVGYSLSLVTNRNATPNNPFGIYVYPNPARQRLTIDDIKLSQNWENLKILDASGKAIMSVIDIKNQTTVTIDINKLKSGTYFVKLVRKNGEFTTLKFVKQ